MAREGFGGISETKRKERKANRLSVLFMFQIFVAAEVRKLSTR